MKRYIIVLTLSVFLFWVQTACTPKKPKEPTLVDVLIKNFQEHPQNWKDTTVTTVYEYSVRFQEKEFVIENKSCGIILRAFNDRSYVTMLAPDTIGFSQMQSDSILKGYDEGIYKPIRDREHRAKIVADSIKADNAKHKILNCK